MGVMALSVSTISQFLRVNLLIYLLPAIGIFLTLYLGFPQFSGFIRGIKVFFRCLMNKEEKDRLKSLGKVNTCQALAIALAAQVGTGNIVGIATAIMAGGPGAVFWLWVSSFLGMATVFAEGVLGQIYKSKDRDGNFVGGPAFYIREGFKDRGMEKFGKVLSQIFAVLLIIGLGFIGNMYQSNSIANSMEKAFGIPPLIMGVLVALLIAYVMMGGINRISKVAGILVPLMVLFYLGLSLVIILLYRTQLHFVFNLILQEAFSQGAILGGASGIAMRKAVEYGITRGLFTNEAGMGSTPHAHSTATVLHPVEQGSVATLGVFIASGLVSTATALAILLTGANLEGLRGVLVAQRGFEIVLGPFGQQSLALCSIFFAFTTILAWYYFGESNIRYIQGAMGLVPYRLIVLCFIILGSIENNDLVWNLTDMFSILLVLPNALALLLLSKEVKEALRDYRKKAKLGKITYDYRYIDYLKIQNEKRKQKMNEKFQ